MLRATLSRPDLDDPALAARWTALARACDASPFQSWAWVGCLARERYGDPVLVELHDAERLAGLALFNRRRRGLGSTMHLHEVGDAAQDTVFIEHNGVVSQAGSERAVLWATLRAARHRAGQVVLSGVGDAWLEAARQAGGILGPVQTRVAPFVRLEGPAVRFEDGLSRNTRAQLRRSDRAYAQAGPIRVERAETAAVAAEWLEALLRLHVAGWSARGVESALATAPVQRFLHALMARGVPDGTVDLLRIGAGERTLGYLLNLCAEGRVAAYQSGFDYAGAGPHEKPGLSCHHAAIVRAQAAGAAEYDFLAGDARYKRSLANDARPLHWFAWQTRLSVPGAVALGKRLLRR